MLTELELGRFMSANANQSSMEKPPHRLPQKEIVVSIRPLSRAQGEAAAFPVRNADGPAK